MNVKEGEIIERGKILGLAGATGRVTGPHLHWGAKVQNTRVDPFSLINLGK
jgi:murein DD-endopeptidase MepM/ murein hydrolase activator NlpD